MIKINSLQNGLRRHVCSSLVKFYRKYFVSYDVVSVNSLSMCLCIKLNGCANKLNDVCSESGANCPTNKLIYISN